MPAAPHVHLFDGETGIVNGDYDNDEWLGMDVHEVIDLRAVLQAEQVVILLLDTREWVEEGRIRWAQCDRLRGVMMTTMTTTEAEKKMEMTVARRGGGG